MKSPFPSIDLGPLPVDLINAALGTELEPGHARLSASANAHIATDHPGDYQTCLAALPAAVAAPSFIGQAPGHTRNFELVRKIGRPNGQAVLVAVAIDIDDAGEYRVRSCYLISAAKVDQRRQAGRLIAPKHSPETTKAQRMPSLRVSERDAIPDLLAARRRLVTWSPRCVRKPFSPQQTPVIWPGWTKISTRMPERRSAWGAEGAPPLADTSRPMLAIDIT